MLQASIKSLFFDFVLCVFTTAVACHKLNTRFHSYKHKPSCPERPNGTSAPFGSAGGSDSRKWQCSWLAAFGKLLRTDSVGALQRDLCQKMVNPSWLQHSSFSAREKRARLSQEALSFTNPSQHCKCFSHLAPRRLGANCSNGGSWKKRGLE